MSDLFNEVFSSGGAGIVRTCVCGITHFSEEYSDESCYEEGELEELREKAKSDPEHYRAQPYCISTLFVNGIEIVECCTCDTAKKFEDLILNNEVRIAEYLNKRAKMLESRAEAIKCTTSS